MAVWIIGGLILAVGAGVITLAWWRLGDQWADDEYKKFGHGGGRARKEGPAPTIVKTHADKPADAPPDP